MALSTASLEGFAAIARRGNLTAAARDLFLTQPALTSRLQRLEQELGVPLFTRTSRGLTPTVFGRELLPHAERTLEAARAARAAVEGLRDGTGGPLSFASVPTIGTYVLPGVLRDLVLRHPGVALSMRSGHSEEVLELVRSGQVELGVVRSIAHPEIRSEPLFEDELVLVAEAGHRLVDGRRIDYRRLADEDLIMFDRTSTYHGETGQLLLRVRVRPRSVIQVTNIDAAKRMVELGLGLAFLPRSALEQELADGRLAELPIADADRMRRAIVAIRRRDAGPLTAAAETLVALLRGYAGER